MPWPDYLTAELITVWNTYRDTPASGIAEQINVKFSLSPPLTRNCVLGKVWRLREQGYKLAKRGSPLYSGIPLEVVE